MLTVSSCDTSDGCMWPAAGDQPPDTPASLHASHAGQRPAFFPPSQRPHPSGSPSLPPRVTWPGLVVACFWFLDDCSCPTGLPLPPPPSQTPGPGATPVIFRSLSWPLPQHRKKARRLSRGADTGSGRLGVGAVRGGEEAGRSKGLLEKVASELDPQGLGGEQAVTGRKDVPRWGDSQRLGGW